MGGWPCFLLWARLEPGRCPKGSAEEGKLRGGRSGSNRGSAMSSPWNSGQTGSLSEPQFPFLENGCSDTCCVKRSYREGAGPSRSHHPPHLWVSSPSELQSLKSIPFPTVLLSPRFPSPHPHFVAQTEPWRRLLDSFLSLPQPHPAPQPCPGGSALAHFFSDGLLALRWSRPSPGRSHVHWAPSHSLLRDVYQATRWSLLKLAQGPPGAFRIKVR